MTAPWTPTPDNLAELLRLRAKATVLVNDSLSVLPASDVFAKAAHAAVPALVAEVENLREELAESTHFAAYKVNQELQTERDVLVAEVTELRDAYELLHQRIAAYDETHAELQRLKTEVERLREEREWCGTNHGNNMCPVGLTCVRKLQAEAALRDCDLRELDRASKERDAYKADYEELCARHRTMEAERDQLQAEVERLREDAEFRSEITKAAMESQGRLAHEVTTLRARADSAEARVRELEQKLALAARAALYQLTNENT